MATVVAILAFVLAAGCGEKRAREPQVPLPVGGAGELDALLLDALRDADPLGAVLIVVWTTDHPPPSRLKEIAGRWRRYGLIPVGICADLLIGEDRDRRMARVRAWEERNRPWFRGMILDDRPDAIRDWFPQSQTLPALILLDERGSLLWWAGDYDDFDGLEKRLRAHLGEPAIAALGTRLADRELTGPRAAPPARGRC